MALIKVRRSASQDQQLQIGQLWFSQSVRHKSRHG